jgi:hypothetical protein
MSDTRKPSYSGPSGRHRTPDDEGAAAVALLSRAHGAPLPPKGRGENGSERAAVLRDIAEKSGVAYDVLRRAAAGVRRLTPAAEKKIENLSRGP